MQVIDSDVLFDLIIIQGVNFYWKQYMTDQVMLYLRRCKKQEGPASELSPNLVSFS